MKERKQHEFISLSVFPQNSVIRLLKRYWGGFCSFAAYANSPNGSEGSGTMLYRVERRREAVM
jgi:hypothetical protein